MKLNKHDVPNYKDDYDKKNYTTQDELDYVVMDDDEHQSDSYASMYRLRKM